MFCFQTASARIDFFDTGSFGNDRSRSRFGDCLFHTRYRQIVEKRFLNVALFLLLCSLWCILDSGIYQMYGSQSAAGTLVSFYAFMTMSVPMLLFIQNTVSESVRWIPQVWIFLLYANAVLQGILHLLFKIPFIHMLYITHLLLFTGLCL